MDKEELRSEILADLTPEDWNLLESRSAGIPISAHNRETLIRLRDCDSEFEGEVDAGKVSEARSLLHAFLENTWAEEPLAHKYVINASLALAFIFEKPMHPWSSVRYLSRASEGEVLYYCSAKEENSICDYCPAKPASMILPVPEDKYARTLVQFGKSSEAMQRIIFNTGFSDAGVIPVSRLEFHDEIRAICEENKCRNYGTTWACPPAVGTLSECRERVMRYQYLQLFSKVYKLADSLDFDEIRKAMADFRSLVLDLDRALRGTYESILILSNESCDRCGKCTYPDAPCRFPEELHPSLEGFGFYVSRLASMAGMNYMNGTSTITFFGAVLY